MKIVFIGDKRGAGLEQKDGDISYQNTHTFRFDMSDSKATSATMPGIKQWEKQHPDQQIYK